jgi:hypothetical protein
VPVADIQVVIDSADPARAASFWAEALGYVVQPPPPGFASWDAFADAIGLPPERRNDQAAVVDPDGQRPRVFFQRVPEPKTVKNRVHVDINVGAGLEGEPRRSKVRARAIELESLGARQLRVVDEPTGWCVVMSDPEGNEFCLQ